MSNLDYAALKKEWDSKGRSYALAINKMVEFGEQDDWQGYYPLDAIAAGLKKDGVAQEMIDQIRYENDEFIDDRANLVKPVLQLLHEANERGEQERFRADFAPSDIINSELNEQLADISSICHLSGDRVVFIARDGRKSTAYMLDGDKASEVGRGFIAMGRAKRGQIYALINEKGEIYIVRALGSAGSNLSRIGLNLSGELVAKFNYQPHEYLDMQILPFNDGSRVLIADHRGIFIVGSEGERLIHPQYDEGELDGEAYIDMAHVTLSNDNKLIVAGEQCYDQAVLDAQGEWIANIAAPCSYPHFALFSEDDRQLIANACHFYNGDTIGVSRDMLVQGLKFAFDKDDQAWAYTGDDLGENTSAEQLAAAGASKCPMVDVGIRVYAGIATAQGYILGDAYGYIKAMDCTGGKLWRHYLGGTIGAMAISDDGRTLWVGTYGGRLHRLALGGGQDGHTIGNGNHREELRLFVFKNKEVLRW